MKHVFLYMMWYYFLTEEQKSNITSDRYQNLYQDILSEEKILEFLYLSSFTSFSSLNHRRNKVFSFNPKNQNDMLFIFYYENKNRIDTISMAQRIFLNRIVFKDISKGKDYLPGDLSIEQIQNPIIVEINNV